MAKLSISIPEELKELLDERAAADQVPVSQVVSEALRRYFELPPEEVLELTLVGRCLLTLAGRQ